MSTAFYRGGWRYLATRPPSACHKTGLFKLKVMIRINGLKACQRPADQEASHRPMAHKHHDDDACFAQLRSARRTGSSIALPTVGRCKQQPRPHRCDVTRRLASTLQAAGRKGWEPAHNCIGSGVGPTFIARLAPIAWHVKERARDEAMRKSTRRVRKSRSADSRR